MPLHDVDYFYVAVLYVQIFNAQCNAYTTMYRL